MLNSVANNIAQFFYNESIINNEEDIEVYAYGVEVLISSLLNILSIVIISFFINQLVGTIIFLVSFSSLRVFAGGYHAKTHINCFLILLFVYGINLSIFYLLPNALFQAIIIVSTIFSAIVILIFAPIEDANKPLDEEERKRYRKISFGILGVLIVIITISLAINPAFFYTLFFANGMLAAATSLLAANIKNGSWAKIE